MIAKKYLAIALSLIILIQMPFLCYADTEAVEYLIEPKFQLMGLGSFNEGLAIFQEDDLSGYIDKSGAMIIPQQYKYAYHFSEGLATVSKGDNQWGFIDKIGKEVIPCIYQWALSFSEGLAKVQKDEKWGFVDKNGKVVVPIQYDEVGNFKEGLAYVKKDGKYGYIDKNGEIIIPFIYEWADDFSEGLVGVGIDFEEEKEVTYFVHWEGWGEPPPNAGKTITEIQIVKTRKYGFIDKDGNTVVPFNYEVVWGFSEGYANVRSNFGWGYVDKNGEEVIPCQYVYAWEFKDGLARAEKGDKWGYIDKKGAEVIPFIYGTTEKFSEGLACVSKEGKFGFIDRNDNTVVPFMFDHAMGFSEGVAWVNKDGLYGVIKNPLAKIIKVNIDGSIIPFEQPPIMENGRVLVPMRAIFEALGATVSWDSDMQTITAIRGNDTIIMKIGDEILKKNSQEIKLDVAPVIVNGRTLVPVRAVAESLNADVTWESQNNTVLIQTKN